MTGRSKDVLNGLSTSVQRQIFRVVCSDIEVLLESGPIHVAHSDFALEESSGIGG